jgi:sugar lactone lactonase YvrE
VDGPSDCCIAVAKGAVYVGTLTGSVYSIGGDGATIAAVPIASAAASAAAPSAAPVARIEVETSWSTDLRNLGIAPIGQIALDPKGRIWAPAAAADGFVILGPDGKVVDHWGVSGSKPGQFDFTRANGDGYGTLAFAKDGSFYVLDVGNRRVQHFDARRKLLGIWGGFGSGPGQYSDPVGIAVVPDGTVLVLDDQRSVVERYRSGGTVIGSFDPFSNAPGNEGSNGLSIDRDGNLFVTQIEPNLVAEFDLSGKLLRTFGDGTVFPGQPSFTAIDSKGRLFVTQGDQDQAVTVFDRDGTLLGKFGAIGPDPDQFAFPAGIALDGKGGLYVSDTWPDTARMVRFALPPDLR